MSAAAASACRSRYTHVFERQADGRWLIVAEHNSIPAAAGVHGPVGGRRCKADARAAGSGSTPPVDSDDAYLCHCRMCQRASGNVSLAMVGIEQADVTLERRARLVSQFTDRPAALLRHLRNVARISL